MIGEENRARRKEAGDKVWVFNREQEHVGLYSPVKSSTLTLNEMENQVTCFNKIIPASGLGLDCRGARPKAGRPTRRQKMMTVWTKVGAVEGEETSGRVDGLCMKERESQG